MQGSPTTRTWFRPGSGRSGSLGSANRGAASFAAEITPVEPDPGHAGEGRLMEQTPSWGIEPVPERLQVLGVVDTLLLWTNLGISLLVLVASAYFGLSLKQALLATLIGAVLGNTMLGVAALIGADARVPTMALQRAPLGQHGSYIATALNVLQCLGWSVFEITVIAIAAGALSDRLFGVHLVWMWKLVFGALGLVLALLGPVGFVRRFVRKIGIWAVAASIVYLGVWIIRNGHVGRLWHEGGSGGSFWLGVDLVIALTVSWVPLVADYTRFSRGRNSAFVGVGLGYLLPTLFQFGFGAILVPLFGVLLADWLVAGRHYTAAHIFEGPLWRPGMIGAWLVGFALYEWIAQTQGLGFWSRWLSNLHPPHGGIGASLPSFAAAFAIALVVARLRRH